MVINMGMNIFVLAFYLMGRVITVFSCSALCKGKWRKIRANIRAKNLIERISLSYFQKARTDYPGIIKFEIISINVELINSILCFILNLMGYFNYMLIWSILWLLHISILTYLFRVFVRK